MTKSKIYVRKAYEAPVAEPIALGMTECILGTSTYGDWGTPGAPGSVDGGNTYDL